MQRTLILPTVRLPRPALPVWLLAGTAALPVFVWWLGWHPGFGSSDTIDQFGQIQSEVYFNHHPAIHTLYLDVLSLGGSRPGLVTLFQLLVLGALLAYAARWLIEAGVPTWLAIGVAWLLGLSPAVAPTTLALWKDVPFALLMLWAWIELLALAVDRDRAERLWPAARLGGALAGIWLLRGNGPITVLPILLVLIWVYRKQIRFVGITLGTAVMAVILTLGPLYTILDVQGSSIEPAQVFLPDVAASYNAEPETFTEADLDLLEEVAPPLIWTERYDCFDSTPLLFDPFFDQTAVRERPQEFLGLEIDVLFRDFDSVLAHRLCAANFVYAPAQPTDAYFHRPPYDFPTNSLGLQRDPILGVAFDISDRVWRWAEPDSRLWLTWRPAIVLLPALAAVVVFAFRARRFLLPSALIVAHTLNVMATTPAQEFRYAYPLYLMAALTLPLLWPTLSAKRSDG
jgi:Family of unknown function (DUF6020)